ncbi:efflux transporter outer membrane subunit [Bordetella sp. FB-8]|uniref:efflux transporter outer membrane subunit n=1 Tax=Bordetella sp. FB-8 TaxID=1159870 RepID=UPI0012DC2764|nr:efflux transporter outer membrane subunit [Bordetella sp. FB-8]
MRKANLSLFLALAGMLAGCTLAPVYHRPAAPVDASYPSGPGYTHASKDQGKPVRGPAADVGWRDFFQDPLLQHLIALSLKDNRDLRVAVLNVQALQAQYRIQRASLMPSAAVSGTETAQRIPASLTASGNKASTQDWQVGPSISWQIDLFGQVRSLTKAALENYLAQDDTRVAAQLSLISQTATAYFTLRADQELLDLTTGTLKAQQASYDLIKQSYDQGVDSALDLTQAETTLRTAQSNQAQYLRRVAQDRNALALLVGEPLPADIAAQLNRARRLPDDALPLELPAGLPSDLLERRPDIRAAEHQLLAANANIGAARAAFFPSISLTGFAGTASNSLTGLFMPGSEAWSLVPKINLPIFQGGSLLANLDLAHVRKKIQVATYEKAIQTGFREVADALAGRGTLDDEIRAQRKLVDASQLALKLSQQRFDSGVDNYLSVLDSQRSLYAAQQGLIATRLARLDNQINLYKALGGGWTGKSVAAPPPAAPRS